MKVEIDEKYILQHTTNEEIFEYLLDDERLSSFMVLALTRELSLADSPDEIKATILILNSYLPPSKRRKVA